MSDLLYLLASFDEKTSNKIDNIQKCLNQNGIFSKQTPNIPHHITLTTYEKSREQEITKLLYDVCSITKSFNLTFNHIGLFGLNVMFLAPDTNYELLDLYNNLDKSSFKDERGWTPHATILIDDPSNIHKAIPLAAECFEKFSASITRISLYEFAPTLLIASFDLYDE